MRTITINIPQDLSTIQPWDIPHICKDKIVPVDLTGPSPDMKQTFDVITLRHYGRWRDIDIGYDVDLWTAKCPDCGQDYQAWNYRKHSDEECDYWHRYRHRTRKAESRDRGG